MEPETSGEQVECMKARQAHQQVTLSMREVQTYWCIGVGMERRTSVREIKAQTSQIDMLCLVHAGILKNASGCQHLNMRELDINPDV
jgi:hypothetical protein